MAFTDTAAGAHHDPDDISLFLRQLLHRASSSSSSSSPPYPPPAPLSSTSMPSIMPSSTFPSVGTHAPDQQLPCFSSLPISNSRTLHHQIPTLSTFLLGSDRLAVNRTSDDSLTGVVMTSPPAYLPACGGSNLSSESLTGSGPIRSADNDYGEDCDCDSEDAVPEGMEVKQSASRNHSKRSRAAEVHNLSEKRRRSKINEKMKALQNLIPNSNKTDKASMLDEAIEYLKQLQLQVQMLSVRNGLSLHPMCLPGVSGILHPAEFSNRIKPLEMNVSNEVNIMPARSDAVFNSGKQCVSSTGPSPSLVTVLNSEPPSYGLESCIQDNFAPFQLRNYPQAVCRDQNVGLGQMIASKPPDAGQTPVEAQRYGLQEMLP